MRRELEKYIPLMEFFSGTVGESFEAGIFDMTDPECPLIGASNSHRKVQEAARAFVVEAADSKMAQLDGYILKHPLMLGNDKIVKLSVYYIRDDEGTTIGALWFGMRCDVLLSMSSFIENMLQFNIQDINSEEYEGKKKGRREPSLDCITEVMNEFGAEPGRTSLAERQEIICDLFDMGVFEIKGAVARTAEELQISEQTVYRYINKLKKARDW